MIPTTFRLKLILTAIDTKGVQYNRYMVVSVSKYVNLQYMFKIVKCKYSETHGSYRAIVNTVILHVITLS